MKYENILLVRPGDKVFVPSKLNSHYHGNEKYITARVVELIKKFKYINRRPISGIYRVIINKVKISFNILSPFSKEMYVDIPIITNLQNLFLDNDFIKISNYNKRLEEFRLNKRNLNIINLNPTSEDYFIIEDLIIPDKDLKGYKTGQEITLNLPNINSLSCIINNIEFLDNSIFLDIVFKNIKDQNLLFDYIDELYSKEVDFYDFYYNRNDKVIKINIDSLYLSNN